MAGICLAFVPKRLHMALTEGITKPSAHHVLVRLPGIKPDSELGRYAENLRIEAIDDD